MSRLPSKLAKALGISVRTLERWCANGLVPGAYRTRGGHWRIRKPSKQVAITHNWNNTPDYFNTRKARITHQVLLHFFPPRCPPEIKRQIAAYANDPVFLDWMMNGQRYENAAMEVALAAHGISDADLNDPDLARRDPDKYHLLYKVPASEFLRGYWHAADNPRTPLMVAATTAPTESMRSNSDNARPRNLVYPAARCITDSDALQCATLGYLVAPAL